MQFFLACVLVFDFGPKTVFQPFPETSEEYINGPAAFVFTPQGSLYVVDSSTARIHIWNKKGEYQKSFGKKGEGPGEFFNPVMIDADERFLWVIDVRGVVSQLDHDGKYLTSFRVNKPRFRRFAALGEGLFLATTRQQLTPTEIYNRVEALDGAGEMVKLLKKWSNESFTTPREGNNYAKVKAFPPACEIQRGADGMWYFGFSQNATLYRADAKGAIQGEVHYDLPAEEATDEEKAMFDDLALPCFGGQSFLFKNFPNIRTDFDHPKAHYTRYAVKKDRVIFLLTPDGGVFGCEGFPRGNWFVCDRESGKLIARGQFDFPEGSLIFARHDRILGFIINDDEDFDIKELDFN